MSLNPQIKHISMMKKIQPAYRYREGEDLTQWQIRARAQLEKRLGLPLIPCDENFRIEWTHEDEEKTEIRFLFSSEEEVDVSCHLLLPKGCKDKKLPLIICLQGHSTGMHISLGVPKFEGDDEEIHACDGDFARQAAARGQAALTIEQRGFGERGGSFDGPQCRQPAVQALLLGRTMLGERCWDISRAIDTVLAHFPQIDAEKIALMGHSGGGTAAIYAAALDTRIAAAMPSCALCGFMPSIGVLEHCICNYVPGIMNDFDMGDLAACIAPRPLVVVSGQKDDIFPIESAKEQVEIAKRVYEAAGEAQQLRHVISSVGHRFYAALSWPAFDEVTGWNE